MPICLLLMRFFVLFCGVLLSLCLHTWCAVVSIVAPHQEGCGFKSQVWVEFACSSFCDINIWIGILRPLHVVTVYYCFHWRFVSQWPQPLIWQFYLFIFLMGVGVLVFSIPHRNCCVEQEISQMWHHWRSPLTLVKTLWETLVSYAKNNI